MDGQILERGLCKIEFVTRLKFPQSFEILRAACFFEILQAAAFKGNFWETISKTTVPHPNLFNCVAAWKETICQNPIEMIITITFPCFNFLESIHLNSGNFRLQLGIGYWKAHVPVSLSVKMVHGWYFGTPWCIKQEVVVQVCQRSSKSLSSSFS